MTPEELRRWSAEDLLEYKFDRQSGYYYIIDSGGTCRYIVEKEDWEPDLDTAPAWQIKSVIEVMFKGGWFFRLERAAIIENGKIWIARFTREQMPTFLQPESDFGIWSDRSPWLAILLAAHEAWKAGKGDDNAG